MLDKKASQLEIGKAYLALQQEGRSTAAIAEAYGVSRNAVCGLLWRTKIALGLVIPKPRSKKPPSPPKEARAKPAKPRVLDRPPPPKKRMVRELRVAPIGTPAPIYELASQGCRFPVTPNDTAATEHLFCNQRRDFHPSYCNKHAQISTGMKMERRSFTAFVFSTELQKHY